LESVIDRFNERFIDDDEHIGQYKKNLTAHVEKVITTDLEDKCTGGLMSRIWSLENEMFNNVKDILGEEYEQKLEQLWRFKQPFKFHIIVDCHQLLADFQEDLEFHFSLGAEAIWKRVVALIRGRPITAIGRNQFGVWQGQNDGSNRHVHKDHDQAVLEFVARSASYVANGSIGVAIMGAFVYQKIGWRVVAAGAAVYAGLYVIERLRWNSNAKEQHLKDQMRSHLASGMRQMGGIHTAQCEAQVARELDQTHHALKVTVGGVHQEMKKKIDELKQKGSAAEEITKTLTGLKGKTNFLLSSVGGFSVKFLSTES